MEYRFVLKESEVFDLTKKFKFLSVCWIKDEYTGTKRFRTDDNGVREKSYKTPVKGVIFKFTALCEVDGYKVWFEHKWTEHGSRCEVEFEEGEPDEYKNRENITGWDILKH